MLEIPKPGASDPTGLTAIRARSRRQAMDWSLVLASQGIEAVIEHHAEDDSWSLWIGVDEYARASQAIRLYRLENRHWGWREQLAGADLSFHWGVLVWCWVMILLFWISEGSAIRSAGVMHDRVAASEQWWRLVTAVTLHSDVGHLAANVSSGFVLLGLAMGRYGPGKALLGALMAGAFGNLLGLWLHRPPYQGLGASGMVMGALGLLAAQLFFLVRHGRSAWRPVVGGLMSGFLLFVLLGMNPASDVIAHAGGFVSGAILGAGLALAPESLAGSEKLDRFLGAVAVFLVTICWCAALLANVR
jgi:membrane associated rhomboid family serine protease